jgi:site-specific recombinase XerD
MFTPCPGGLPGPFKTPEPGSLTVRQAIDCYLGQDAPSHSQDAAKERRRVLDLFCKAFGDRLIGQLKPYDLLLWINAHTAWASGHTKNRVKSTICRPFNFLTRLGVLDRNPFLGLSYPTGGTGRDMTDTEFQLLLRAAGPLFRRILVFLRYSGARPIELRRLEWDHVSQEIQAVVQKIHKTARTTGRPRRIILTAVCLKLLAWIKRHRAHESKYVFVNARGGVWKKRALCKHMERIRDRAGLTPDVKLYSARHAFGTRAILNGVDIATLGVLMGHQSVRTTQIYVHLADKQDHLLKAAEQAVRRR